MYRKINIFVNHSYLCSTNQAKTCKQAVANTITKISNSQVFIAGDGFVTILQNAKITAHFDKRS